MIKIEKVENQNFPNIFDFKITNNNKCLYILFGGNGDLYFYVNKKDDIKKINFEITKENYFLYSLFEELFDRIINCKIHEIDEFQIEQCETLEELNELLKYYEKWNLDEKESYSYQTLVIDNHISYRHDDECFEEANILNIYKEDNKFKLEFILQNKKMSHYIDVRIRNSGSRYIPFNQVFMKLYNSLQEYDPNYQQIHIEEYMYQKMLKKEK